MKKFFILSCLLVTGMLCAIAQTPVVPPINNAPVASLDTSSKAHAPKKWYESISVRGYMQVRYNRLLETNPDLRCEQCDKSWGNNNGLFLRRARLVVFGQVSKQIYFYLQPDFASAVNSTTQNFGQLRDAYFDVGFDKENEFRARIGQSKIPYGFENMQSSQNRLPLDRADATNSAIVNERDIGVFLYYAPSRIRKLFSSLVSEGLKGSGDYGVFGFGVYNGQTANKPELNNELHMVGRASYPFEIGNQVIEPGIQAYTGKYVVPVENISKETKYNDTRNYTDERIGGTLVLYPKPFGVTAEYNIGNGPEYNTVTDSIETQKLHGGYIMLCYMMHVKSHVITPFTRAQYYKGGKKHELDARSYNMNEYEIGIEWQPVKAFEFTAMYTISSRRFQDHVLQNNLQEGSLLRLQAQVNF